MPRWCFARFDGDWVGRLVRSVPTSVEGPRPVIAPILAAVLFGMLLACTRQPSTSSTPTRAEIWETIQERAERYRIDPRFVYALVAAESNFDPRAHNGEARGLLQLKPAAWSAVSNKPYDPHVWEWRMNLEVGIDYLAYSRSFVHRHTEFTYPKLLAAFHYGTAYLAERQFDPRRVPVPDNAIFRELWRGNLTPIAPPE